VRAPSCSCTRRPPDRRPPDRRPPDRRPATGRPTPRLTTDHGTNATGHGTNAPGTTRPLGPADVLEELEILDEIAKRVSGDMVNAGIAKIDTLWTAGQDLQRPLQTYRSLALRASPQYTAGLWTLIAWIHWRTGNRAEAWPALHLAKKIDNYIAAAHYLTVFMHTAPTRTPSHPSPTGSPPAGATARYDTACSCGSRHRSRGTVVHRRHAPTPTPLSGADHQRHQRTRQRPKVSEADPTRGAAQRLLGPGLRPSPLRNDPRDQGRRPRTVAHRGDRRRGSDPEDVRRHRPVRSGPPVRSQHRRRRHRDRLTADELTHRAVHRRRLPHVVSRPLVHYPW